MKNTIKILIVGLSLFTVFCLPACNGTNDPTSPSDPTSPTSPTGTGSRDDGDEPIDFAGYKEISAVPSVPLRRIYFEGCKENNKFVDLSPKLLSALSKTAWEGYGYKYDQAGGDEREKLFAEFKITFDVDGSLSIRKGSGPSLGLTIDGKLVDGKVTFEESGSKITYEIQYCSENKWLHVFNKRKDGVDAFTNNYFLAPKL